MNQIRIATIKATGEKIKVYRLENYNWYDYDAINDSINPTAPKAGKKEFEKKELIFNR